VKLLFDENLSYRLVGALEDTYSGSVHVRDLGLEGAEDLLIWRAAALLSRYKLKSGNWL
jgi:predicted nuclease of predicted toxin-antitoxin system